MRWAVFLISYSCFVFNTFQVTLERIIHVRKVACALGRVIATEDILPNNFCRLPNEGHAWAAWRTVGKAPGLRALMTMGLYVTDS